MDNLGHTLTPWRVIAQKTIKRRLGQRFDIAGDGFVASDVQRLDAEHIVRCVNSHDVLMEALTAIAKDGGPDSLKQIDIMWTGSYYENTKAIARAALAKAKEA